MVVVAVAAVMLTERLASWVCGGGGGQRRGAAAAYGHAPQLKFELGQSKVIRTPLAKARTTNPHNQGILRAYPQTRELLVGDMCLRRHYFRVTTGPAVH